MSFLSSHQKGFTLLETLAVLVILTLVMTLLLEGLSSVYQIRTSLGNNLLSKGPRQLLHQHWLRTIISNMTADSAIGSHKFSGSETRLQGLTLAPLFGKPGVPTPVSLKIKQEKNDACVLFYKEEGQELLQLGKWQQAKCNFSYLNSEGKNSEQQQHFQTTKQYQPKDGMQLPQGVLFTVINERKEPVYTIFSAITGYRENRVFFAEFLK